MAKAIKFNLICDGTPVRTIEDLQENFSIEDVLGYYNSGLLQRWLKVRGYDDALERVGKVDGESPLRTIQGLIKAFEVAADDREIEEGAYMLEFLERKKEALRIYKEEGYKAKSVVDGYRKGYERLVEGILENPKNAARIKASIAEMAESYAWAMDLNHRELFWKLSKESPLAIMCLLMNERTRGYYLPTESKKESGAVALDINASKDKENMFAFIKKLVEGKSFPQEMGEDLLVFSGVTDGYWKDLEPKGKKYMVISMGVGDYIRPSAVSGGDIPFAGVLNKFAILDGIDYKCKSSGHRLLYMEV